MRLFTGLDLPAEVVRNLEELLVLLRAKAPKLQWSPPANLHITTKFIGTWPEERLEDLKAALASVPTRPVIPVRIERLGFYPNPHSPRVLFCIIEAPGLKALANDIDQATATLSIESEKREFSPHLTLARIKERIRAKVNLQPMRETIAALPSQDFGSFDATRFFLYQSKSQATGSVYTKLAEFLLSK